MMAQTKVKLGKRIKCLRCEHEWLPRQEIVTICPKCKSGYWNIPKKDSLNEPPESGE